MKKFAPTLIKLVFGFGFGGIMVYLVLDNYEFSQLTTDVDRYRVLCDAFTIPGVTILMLGLLVFLSNLGAMDSLTFFFGGLFKRLLPIGRWRDEKDENYADYIARRRANKAVGYGFIFIIGGVFLAVAIVFMILFYSVY